MQETVGSASTVTKSRARVSPVEGTVKTITGYPKKLIVYRVIASPYYWTRVFINGRYHVKSTKTNNLNHAKEFAKKFFHELLINPEHNNNIFTMRRLINLYQNSTESNNPSKYQRNNISRIKNHIEPYFGDKELKSIANNDLIKFQYYIQDKNLGSASLKSNFTLLKTLFNFALNNGYINQIPVFPRLKYKPNDKKPRVNLELEEYKHLCNTAELIATQGHSVRGVEITKEIKYLIQFMVNSFIRPSDLRVIKHKHVTIKTDGEDTWLQLSHPATKTTDDVIQAMPTSVYIYTKIVEELRQTTIDEVDPEDYLFFPQYQNRNTAMAAVEKSFRYVRQAAFPEDDRNITLYSLRHTAIMLRITIGNVDTFSLAKNARTSQEMIEKFYARHVKTLQLRKQLHAMPDKK